MQIDRPTMTDSFALEYQRLRRRLEKLRDGKMEFLSIAAATVSRGLNWPLLGTADQLVLSILHDPLSDAVNQGTIDPATVELCLEGLDILIDRNSPNGALSEWASRIRRTLPEVLVPWLPSSELGIVPDWEL